MTLQGRAVPIPHHGRPRAGSAPHLMGVGPVAWTDQSATTQAHIEGFELALSNIHPFYDLLEHT